MTKLIQWLIVALLTGILACFAYCAVWLNAHTGPEERPRIDIIGSIEEVSFYGKTLYYLRYMIDGYPQQMDFENESDIELFINRLRMVGEVYE
jgi:hypothetical protein